MCGGSVDSQVTVEKNARYKSIPGFHGCHQVWYLVIKPSSCTVHRIILFICYLLQTNYYLLHLNSRICNITTLWWLCDLISLTFTTHVCGMFSTIWYSKKTFFADFSHAFCQFVIIIMLALGDVWLKPCFPTFIHIIALDFLFFITTSVLREEMLLSNSTFTTSYVLGFRGNLNRVWLLEIYSPVAWWKPTNHSYRYRFLDMERAKFKFASRAVGGNVHCCIAENTF